MESERTYVAVGCSTTEDYAFLAPLTALFWRDIAGFRPLILLVGTEDEWRSMKRTCMVVEALAHHGIDRYFVPAIDGYEASTIAQNVRQHAAALAWINDNDWVMLSDADLWPLRGDFYQQHQGRRELAVCYYANGDHFQGKNDVLVKSEALIDYQSIPTCHVTMRAREWREMYRLVANDVRGSLAMTLNTILKPIMEARPKEAAWRAWMSDQRIVTEKLCQQEWFPDQAKLINRRGHPPVDRLDRNHPENWFGGFDPSRWIDAHVHKNPASAERWPTIVPIVDHLLPEHAAWARTYREEYVRV